MTRRRHGKPVDVPPNGSAAPLTISAICHTDAVVDALSARHFVVAAGPRKAGVPDGADPAVRLLQSLILDVDQGVSAASAPAASAPSAKRSPAPSPCPAPSPSPVPSTSAPRGRPRRRGARTVMALGISTAVLGTTGVAAAGGDLGRTFERSIGVHQQPAQPHPDSRAQLKSKGRSVVVGPTPGTSERGGASVPGHTTGGGPETARPVPRPGVTPDRGQSPDRPGGGQDGNSPPDREPREIAPHPDEPTGTDSPPSAPTPAETVDPPTETSQPATETAGPLTPAPADGDS